MFASASAANVIWIIVGFRGACYEFPEVRPGHSGCCFCAFGLPFVFASDDGADVRHTAAAKDLNYHVYAVVPLTGSGTAADPKRPMFVPAQGFKPVVPVVAAGRVTAVRTGILGYHAQISDDGKYALSGIHRRFEGGLERDPDDKRFESDHFSEGRTRQEPD